MSSKFAIKNENLIDPRNGKTLIIIEARLGSARFPAKVIKK